MYRPYYKLFFPCNAWKWGARARRGAQTKKKIRLIMQANIIHHGIITVIIKKNPWLYNICHKSKYISSSLLPFLPPSPQSVMRKTVFIHYRCSCKIHEGEERPCLPSLRYALLPLWINFRGWISIIFSIQLYPVHNITLQRSRENLSCSLLPCYFLIKELRGVKCNLYCNLQCCLNINVFILARHFSNGISTLWADLQDLIHISLSTILISNSITII